MKLITTVQGTTVLHYSMDDVSPVGGFLLRDWISLVGDEYQFTVRPEIPPGIPPAMIPILQFQSGFLDTDDGRLAIVQLMSYRYADVITCNNTDLSDKIVDNYTSLLDSALGFRFATGKTSRTYNSNIVVEFDAAIEHRLSALGHVEKLITGAVKQSKAPYKIKRLSFGHGDPLPPEMLQTTPKFFDEADLLIERRAKEPYENNRYFCSGPLRTGELVSLMEKIEHELSD